MKKIFFELTSNSKKKEKKKQCKKELQEVQEEEVEGEVDVASSTTTKTFRVKELLKDSELKYIESQYKQQNTNVKTTSGNSGYVISSLLDSVGDANGDFDTSWLEPNGHKAEISKTAPEMREYFEKKSIVANVKSGDQRMLRKLFWFREKESHEVKTRFLDKPLLQFRKSLHFSQMFAYLSKKLEMPYGSNVVSVAWSSSGGFLACGCDTGLVKVLKIEVLEQESDQGKSKGYLAAPTNISKNQTLEGHTAGISAIAWNQKLKKLTTSDAKGLTIVWKFCRNSWCEEMVHNREGHAVNDLAWSNCGKKICIIYADGAVMVGTAEGSRLWGSDPIIENADLTGIAWSPNGAQILFAVSTGEILVYNPEGTMERKLILKELSRPKSNEDFEDLENEPKLIDSLVCIRWHKASANCFNWTVPTLAVIWKYNCMYLLRDIGDEQPVIVKTQLLATCGAWSPKGDFMAVGGSPVPVGFEGFDLGDLKTNGFDQVNVFSPFGSFLQTVKFPGTPCMSIGWDSLSLRLAVGVGENVYFANVRPCYKFALLGSNTLVYAFSRCDGASQLGFWDGEKLHVQEIPGKVVDIKGNEVHCAVLSLTSTGCYNVTILNIYGDPIDSITIVTIDPFMINLTGSVLIAVALNAITIWRFECNRVDCSIHCGGGDLVARRRLKSFHIDESPSIIGESTDENKLKDPTDDPASCSDAVGQMLIVCRESGKLQIYSLPHGALMNTVDTAYEMNFRPSRIWLNMDGSQVAMIDKLGHLSVCSLGSASIKTALARKLERKDVWNIIWAADNPNLICVMEKTKMYVIRNGEAEDPVLTSAYLASFKDLKVTSVLMDELMFNPEEPRMDLMITLETRALRETRRLLQSETCLQEVTEFVQKNSHKNLWKLLGDEALSQLNLELAESSFAKAWDFAGISIAKKISTIPNTTLRNAEVAAYFGEFQKAAELYNQADRKDLASEMWRLVNEWKRVDSSLLNKQRQSDTSTREVAAAKGDTYFENQEWNKAITCYEIAGQTLKVFKCLALLEDFPRLEKLTEALPEGDPLLHTMAKFFHSRGLCNEAVNAYLKHDYDRPETAIDAAISLTQWNLALQVARNYSLDKVEPLLLRYVVHLLHSGKLMTAVQLMIKSRKPYGAGKLLVIAALRELKEQRNINLVQIKKLFVFAAMLFEYQGVTFLKHEQTSISQGNGLVSDSESMDVFFENNIQKPYRLSPEVYRWMKETPWRGAEAVHYLILTQTLLYKGSYEASTRTALYLKKYADVLGDELINSMIALTSLNSQNFGICSRAFMQLETIDESYSEISSEVFSKYEPEDSNSKTLKCYKCELQIPDFCKFCTHCGAPCEICAFTGQPLLDLTNVWTCQVCKHSSDLREIKSRHSCPFCHSERLSSLKNLN